MRLTIEIVAETPADVMKILRGKGAKLARRAASVMGHRPNTANVHEHAYPCLGETGLIDVIAEPE